MNMQLSDSMIDLNCDLGESFGAYRLGSDEEVMPYITSANIACGFHAGDPETMRGTVAVAVKHGLDLGAHPGFPDLVGFGRRAMALSPGEVENVVLYQIGALHAFAMAQQARLSHVKPHGALYNMAATDGATAEAIAKAVKSFDPQLIVVCQAGSLAAQVTAEQGLRVAREGFADRAYNTDGSLRSRRLPGAVIEDQDSVVRRALQMARDGTVETLTGETVPLHVDTICLHGDTPGAPALARAIRVALVAAGLKIAPLSTFLPERAHGNC